MILNKPSLSVILLFKKVYKLESLKVEFSLKVS